MENYKFLVKSENICTIVMLYAESQLDSYLSILKWINSNPFDGINYNSIELIKDDVKPLIVISDLPVATRSGKFRY